MADRSRFAVIGGLASNYNIVSSEGDERGSLTIEKRKVTQIKPDDRVPYQSCRYFKPARLNNFRQVIVCKHPCVFRNLRAPIARITRLGKAEGDERGSLTIEKRKVTQIKPDDRVIEVPEKPVQPLNDETFSSEGEDKYTAGIISGDVGKLTVGDTASDEATPT